MIVKLMTFDKPLRSFLPYARLCFLAGFCWLLTSCAAWRPEVSEAAWPDSIPPRAEFAALYEEDDANRAVQSEREYLLWIKRFYVGWRLYGQGWNDLVPDVMAHVADPLARLELTRELNDTGKIIAGEWAKDVDSRRIETRHLAIWGEAMREAVVRGDPEDMVRRIIADVNDLMDQTLSRDAIDDDRYYAVDANDVFR